MNRIIKNILFFLSSLLTFLWLYLIVYCNQCLALDVKNAKMQKIAVCKNGSEIGQIKIIEGTGSMPACITGFSISSSGEIIVADANNFRIQKFNQEGIVTLSFGKKGKGTNEFWNINDLISDYKDNLYVSDNHKIKIYDQSGEYIKEINTADSNSLGEMPLLYFYTQDILTAQQEYGNELAYDFSILDDKFLGVHKYKNNNNLNNFLYAHNLIEGIGFDSNDNYYAVFYKEGYKEIQKAKGRTYIGIIKKMGKEYKITRKIDLIYNDYETELDGLYEKNFELDIKGNIYTVVGNLDQIYIYKIIANL